LTGWDEALTSLLDETPSEQPRPARGGLQ
jgi:hypothetical protein